MNFRSFAVIGLTVLSSYVYAAPLDSYSVVTLHNGINKVDFTNDGKDDLVVIAHRENFNAHDFDVVSFYADEPGPDKSKTLGMVSFFTNDKEGFTVTTSGGADCVLKDFRLLKPKSGNKTLLIFASRKFTESFAENNVVVFDYYELQSNADQVPGAPYLSFKHVKAHESTAKFCDVNEAFKKELGLADYRQR